MTSLIQKRCCAADKAITFPLKFCLVGIFAIMMSVGLFTPGPILANFPNAWSIDFETSEGYNVGDLNGQQGWSGSAYLDVSANDLYIFNGDQGIQGAYYNANLVIQKVFDVEDRVDTSLTDDLYYLNIPLKHGTGYGYLWINFLNTNTARLGITNHALQFDNPYVFNCETGEYLYYSTRELLNPVPDSTWVVVNLKFDLTNNLIWVGYTIDGVKTDWSEDNNQCLWYNQAKTDVILDRYQATHFRTADLGFDNLNNEITCGPENCTACLGWFDCQVVGCCWYYQPWYPPPLDNYCDTCEGECSYPLNCGLCETEATCETAGCYWTGDYCTQFEWECGGELACQFCATQETCEAEGCNWNTLSETCWYAVPTLPSDWSTYYDEHGGYDDPAEFVNELAETTGKTFAVISGLFEGFLTSFNSADALAKGSAMGYVIPKSRGYLKIFDGLFGHYPIGETFVFILIFMLAIGLFRISYHLIQLIKP